MKNIATQKRTQDTTKKNTSHGLTVGGNGSANGPVKEWVPPAPLKDVFGTAPLPSTLSVAEGRELEQLEMVIKSGWTNFLAVGHALISIQQGRLYRDKFETFEAYCRDQLEMSRTHAYNLIGSTEVYDELSANADIVVKPKNEFQVRSLISLPKEKRLAAWKLALKQAGEKPLTALVVRQVATAYKAKTPKLTAKKTPPIDSVKLQSVFTLLNEVEKIAKVGDKAATLRALKRLRNCLESLAESQNGAAS